ncbi:ATPase AAA [Spirochaetia bacterium]|nr:ATPase AAA [Spirochaetia bacterium]
MGVKINTRELIRILELTPDHQNIMLVGRHGIGKSAIIEQFFSQKQARVVTLFLGQMSDPGDLIGLPSLDIAGGAASGKTEFRPPWWFPLDNKPVVLFLDELNRARPEILQTVMDLILSKTLAGRTLPPGSRVISAVNEGEEYQLTDLDPALLSRFNIYYFSPTAAEWLLWAAEQKLDHRVIRFIEQNPDCLDGDIMLDAGLEKGADRRSWTRLSEILAAAGEIDETVEKIMSGIVGISAAFKFSEFVKDNTAIDPRGILSGFDAAKEEVERMDAHELSALNESFFRIIEIEGNDEQVKQYITNLEAYIKWLSDEKRNEVLAHWTTLYESPLYPKTKVAILSNSPFIFQNIIGFIDGIKL